MPFTTWIRDLFGIRKDVVDIEKAKLEIAKLEDEAHERSIITTIRPVKGLDEIEKYDPKTRDIMRKARFEEHVDRSMLHGPPMLDIPLLIVGLLFLVLVISGLLLLVVWYFR